MMRAIGCTSMRRMGLAARRRSKIIKWVRGVRGPGRGSWGVLGEWPESLREEYEAYNAYVDVQDIRRYSVGGVGEKDR
jgi:hypothetical protein